MVYTKQAKEPARNSDSRDRIIEASFQEFGRHGYEGASTNQICQAAGISKGLLYHYFKSKENLFFSVCDRCIQDLESVFEKDWFEGKKSDLDALLFFYQKQAEFFLTHPDHYHILTQILNSSCESVESYISEKQKKYREQVGLALRLFLSRSRIRAGVDKELALEIMLEMVSNLQNRYLDSDRLHYLLSPRTYSGWYTLQSTFSPVWKHRFPDPVPQKMPHRTQTVQIFEVISNFR